MRIAIDLTALYNRPLTGIEYYALDLYRALLKTKHEIIPIVHAERIDNNINTYIIKKTNRLYLENISLSIAIRRIKADIVFFPVFPPPIDIYFGCKSKIYKVVHDLVHFEHRDTIPFAAKYYYTPKIIWMLKNADRIITISETTKNKLKYYTKRPVFNCGENISLEFKDADKLANISHLQKWELKESKYIISVSTIEPRKNLKYLLKVVTPLLINNGLKLVLVGKKRNIKDKDLLKLIEELQEYIIFTGYIEQEYLVSLYRYAYAFILLSKYEGFGRTPFEAVACGCRKIILSDIDIFRETFSDNATFLPLNSVDKCSNMLLEDNLISVKGDFKIPFYELEQNLDNLLKV